MGSPPQRPEMIDVELLDEFGAPADGPGVPPRHAGDTTQDDGRDQPHGGPRGRHVAVGAFALLVAVAVVAGVVLQRTQDHVVADLGVSAAPDLTIPPEARWYTEVGSPFQVAGSLLTHVRRDGDDVEIRAVELAGGTEAWVTRLPAEGTTQVWCPLSVDGPSGVLLVCQARGELLPTPRPGLRAQDPGRLFLLDVGDGTVVREERLDPRHVGIAEIDGDLVTAEISGGTLVVAREDVEADAVVWSTDVPVAAEPSPVSRTVVARYGLVGVGGPDLVVLDGADGSLLGRQTVRRALRWDTSRDLVLAPHGFALRSPGRRDTPVTEWTVTASAAGPHADRSPSAGPAGAAPEGPTRLPGAVVEPRLNDGSVPDVVLSTPDGSTLQGVHARTGEPLWSVPDLPEHRVILRGDGTVVLAAKGSARAIDVRTGEERWAVTDAVLDEWHAVSDGRFILATGADPGSRRVLSAVSLTDGSLLWRVAMPVSTGEVVLEDGHLLARGARLVASLG